MPGKRFKAEDIVNKIRLAHAQLDKAILLRPARVREDEAPLRRGETATPSLPA